MTTRLRSRPVLLGRSHASTDRNISAHGSACNVVSSRGELRLRLAADLNLCIARVWNPCNGCVATRHRSPAGSEVVSGHAICAVRDGGARLVPFWHWPCPNAQCRARSIYFLGHKSNVLRLAPQIASDRGKRRALFCDGDRLRFGFGPPGRISGSSLSVILSARTDAGIVSGSNIFKSH